MVNEMIGRIFFGLVRFVVFIVAVPTAFIVGVWRGTEAAMEIMAWPDDACDWLKKTLTAKNAFRVLLAVSGFSASLVGIQAIYSARHLSDNPILNSLASRIGIAIGGEFFFLTGLAVFLIATRKDRKPLRETMKFIFLP